jgi:hypothetical protein
MGGPFAQEDIVEEMDGRRERVHITAASAAYLNHPVERTAYSAGSVFVRGAVPVGRRSPAALI